MPPKKSNMIIMDAIIRFFNGRHFLSAVQCFERDCAEFGLAVRTMVMDWNMYIHCAHKDERGGCSLWFVWTLESEDVYHRYWLLRAKAWNRVDKLDLVIPMDEEFFNDSVKYFKTSLWIARGDMRGLLSFTTSSFQSRSWGGFCTCSCMSCT